MRKTCSSRAADVTLKERRKLVLVARETPLGLVHLRNMTALAEMGVTILPPMLTYYQHPQSIEDMTTHIVGKIMREFRAGSPRLQEVGRIMIGDATLTRLVRGKEIVLNARRQGGDCLVSVTGGDAPHIGAAALCADGEIRRLDRQRAPRGRTRRRACRTCGVQTRLLRLRRVRHPFRRHQPRGNRFRGRGGQGYGRHMARLGLPSLKEGQALVYLIKQDALPKGTIPARGAPYIGLPIPPFERRTRARLRDAARAPRPGRYARSRSRTGSVPARSRHMSRNQ